MDFREEIVGYIDKDSFGIVIMEAETNIVSYIDGLLAKKYGRDIIGKFGDDYFLWLSDCPKLSKEEGLVIWEKIDSEAGRYYRIESSVFEKDGKLYQMHKMQDITEYMKINRDITRYIGFFKKLSKFQAAILEKLSNSYYELLPMLSDYYVTSKVYFVLQHEDYLDITTYTKIGGQYSNDRVEMNPMTFKVFKQPVNKDIALSDFDESIQNVFRISGSNDDSVFRCLCQGDVSEQKYAVYVGVWPNTDIKSMQENVVINVIKLYLENGIMRENLIYKSEHDQLTGLYNKSKYMSMSQDVYTHLDSIAVFNFDVNNLKKINDTYGHEAGDKLIIKAADSIRKVTNNQVHAYRVGGDEFLMVACDMDKDKVDQIRKRWEHELERLNTLDDGINCVIAVGMAYSDKPYDYSQLAKKADELMYEDKKKKKKPGEEMR
ncbi:MAG: GGDEF domain-containing protein [Lachnospiraceae bacterium]|nr:GGDEF domain-containing protein [Lachnospiraceae bacterium]